jgi:hypothetical protein
MAEIGISEFTFGYAFLFEQTQANWGNLRAAPVLPSLQQEEQEGWDARLPLNGVDFYYQFKLSEYLWRGNATYIRNGMYNNPYYRIWLHQPSTTGQLPGCRSTHSRVPPGRQLGNGSAVDLQNEAKLGSAGVPGEVVCDVLPPDGRNREPRAAHHRQGRPE